MPGNLVQRTTRSGHVQTRTTELVYGYFWMLKDLRKTAEKPILSNENLIDESVAKVFPTLTTVKSLSDGASIDLPAHCLYKNRSKDVAAQCTLVTVSFRDFGYQQLSSWVGPFATAFTGNDRVEVIYLNVAEGWLNRFFLQSAITAFTKHNTPSAQQEHTYLYFGNVDAFRDVLRMHNVLCGYVFLLDGLGRVRWAGSGVATDEEVNRLILLAKQLTPLLQQQQRKGGGRLAPVVKLRGSSRTKGRPGR